MKRDIQTFRAVCHNNHMTDEQIYAFSEHIHELKESGYRGSGTRGDFTYQELDELAKEFLGITNE
jgi:hypothetical protein